MHGAGSAREAETKLRRPDARLRTGPPPVSPAAGGDVGENRSAVTPDADSAATCSPSWAGLREWEPGCKQTLAQGLTELQAQQPQVGNYPNSRPLEDAWWQTPAVGATPDGKEKLRLLGQEDCISDSGLSQSGQK